MRAMTASGRCDGQARFLGWSDGGGEKSALRDYTFASNHQRTCWYSLHVKITVWFVSIMQWSHLNFNWVFCFVSSISSCCWSYRWRLHSNSSCSLAASASTSLEMQRLARHVISKVIDKQRETVFPVKVIIEVRWLNSDLMAWHLSSVIKSWDMQSKVRNSLNHAVHKSYLNDNWLVGSSKKAQSDLLQCGTNAVATGYLCRLTTTIRLVWLLIMVFYWAALNLIIQHT